MRIDLRSPANPWTIIGGQSRRFASTALLLAATAGAFLLQPPQSRAFDVTMPSSPPVPLSVPKFTPAPQSPPPSPSYQPPAGPPPPVYVQPQPSPAELQQRRATVINNEGVVADNKGDHARALALFEQALGLATNPTSIKIYRQNIARARGSIAYEHKDYSGCVRFMKEALSLATDLHVAQVALKHNITLEFAIPGLPKRRGNGGM